MNITVAGYCRIYKNKIILNNKNVFDSPNLTFTHFAENAYRKFQIDYPKFHKMDNLAKLGFLGSDILLKNKVLKNEYNPYDLGVILSNKNASLDTDIKHHRQIQTGPASPAVFVYSLPNIVIGEICIRHGIKGENTFFISNEYDIRSQVNYVSLLLNSGTIKACIAGWVEFAPKGYELFLYLVEQKSSSAGIPFTADQIKKLYNSNHE